MTEKELTQIKDLVTDTIKTTVNGKIDRLTSLMEKHNVKHEEDMVAVRNHMKEMAPVLENYKTFDKTIEGVQKAGKATIGVSIFVTSLSAAYWVIKNSLK